MSREKSRNRINTVLHERKEDSTEHRRGRKQKIYLSEQTYGIDSGVHKADNEKGLGALKGRPLIFDSGMQGTKE